MNTRPPSELSIDELEALYKTLTDKGTSLERDKNKIEARLAERKQTLKSYMEQAREEGFEPDKLQDDIRHMSEVIGTKLTIYRSELEAAEKIIRPMLAEIQKA